MLTATLILCLLAALLALVNTAIGLEALRRRYTAKLPDLAALDAQVASVVANLDKYSAPRSCATSGHEFEPVYNIKERHFSETELSRLSNAAYANNEGMEDLLRAAKSAEKTYVHSMCRRCGCVAGHPQAADHNATTQPNADEL